MTSALQHLLRPSFGRAWLLALLLLAAQAAGLAHRVAHAPGQGGHSLSAQGAGSSWNASHAAGSADCLLVDALAHADALCSPVLTLAALPVFADAATAPAIASLPARPAQAYRARGPPQA